MKKFLALILSIAMLLIPMSAFAVTAGTIETLPSYLNDNVIINGMFTDPDTTTADVNEAKDKIATLVVLRQDKTLTDITGTNLLDPNVDLILWADDCIVNENGEFSFTIDTFEMPDYTGSGAGYNFYIAAPGVAETFSGTFTYNRADMERTLVSFLNDGGLQDGGIDQLISSFATARVTREANAIALADATFEADVVAAYSNLGLEKGAVQSALNNQTFTSFNDFVRKLRVAIDAQTTVTPTPPAGGGATGGGTTGGGGGTAGGGGSFGGAAAGGVVAPQGPVNPFLDIPSTYWGKDAIVSLYNKGIVKGKGEGYFRPADTITRAEFVQMVVVAFGFIMQGRTPDFADVTDNDWFANSVKIAYANGVVKGTTDTTFSPSNNITRQDMMTILYNAAKTKGMNLTNGSASFTDAGSISGYAQEAVAAMVGSNVVSGYTDGSVKPLNNASRAEAAAMLSRLLEVR